MGKVHKFSRVYCQMIRNTKTDKWFVSGHHFQSSGSSPKSYGNWIPKDRPQMTQELSQVPASLVAQAVKNPSAMQETQV